MRVLGAEAQTRGPETVGAAESQADEEGGAGSEEEALGGGEGEAGVGGTGGAAGGEVGEEVFFFLLRGCPGRGRGGGGGTVGLGVGGRHGCVDIGGYGL